MHCLLLVGEGAEGKENGEELSRGRGEVLALTDVQREGICRC